MGRFGRKLRAVLRHVQHLVSTSAIFMHICGYHTHLVCSGIRYSLNDVVCAIDLLLELDHRCRSVICVCVLRTSPWRSIVIPEQINGIVVFQDIPHATNVVDVGHALVCASGRPMPLFDVLKRIPAQYMLKSGHINTCCILHIMGRSFRNFCDWHSYAFLVVRVLKRFPLVHKCDQRGIDRILVFVDDRLFLRRMPRRICIDRCASRLPRRGGFLCLLGRRSIHSPALHVRPALGRAGDDRSVLPARRQH